MKGLTSVVICALLILACATAGLSATIYVKWDSPTDGPGTTWGNAYHTIQQGLNAAGNGDIVQVAGPHTYAEDIVMTTTGVTLLSADRTAVISGGTAKSPIVRMSATSIIDGFTISGGRTGIRCTAGNPNIVNCTLSGMSIRGIEALVGVQVHGNIIKDVSPCTQGGAGILLVGTGQSMIASNLIMNNHTATNGAGIAISSGENHSFIVNNTFIGNSATGDGGAIITDYLFIYLKNNIFVGNSATNGSCIYLRNLLGTGDIAYNTFYSNGTNQFYPAPWYIIGYDNNNDDNPMFVGSYRLQPESTCVNTGDNAYVFFNWTDLMGLPRKLAGIVDRGCYEGASVPINTKVVGDWVELRDKSVTGMFGSFGYIEEPNRVSGIRILPLNNALPISGLTTTVAGQIVMSGNDLAIQPVYYGSQGAGSVKPLGMPNKSLGVLNQGLYVRVWGKVTDSGCGYFSLTDGSGTSVLVFLAGQTYAVDDYVVVTGVHASNGIYATTVAYYMTVEERAASATTPSPRRLDAPKPPTIEELIAMRARKR